MKLALITPKSAFLRSDSGITNIFETSTRSSDGYTLMPLRYKHWSGGNLGLLIVAALTPPDFEVDFIDENYEEINFDIRYDLVGISAMTQQATRAYEIADEFRKRGVKVVIGGIHATVLPEEAKEHADSVVMGEAENTWPEFIKDLRKGQVKPYYKSETPVDLSQSPVPRYELLKKYDYKMIWVQTTRGCPRDCEFCVASNIFGKKYRHKAISQVLNEINYVRGLWNEPLINFADDNMFVNRSYSYELVKRLKSMELRWLAQTDVSLAEDDEFLELLRKSGCVLLFIGFETLSKQGGLDRQGWKGNKIERYPEIIRKIQSYGIGIMGAFIIGLDEDGMTIFDDLSRFIIDSRLYAAQITVLTPLPGTRLRKRLLEQNRIVSSDWKRYTFEDVNFIPKRMKPGELQEGLLEIYKRIYAKDARMAVVRHFKEIYAQLYKREMRSNGYGA